MGKGKGACDWKTLTIESHILNKINSRRSEFLPSRIRGSGLREIRTIRPSTNRQYDLQFPILLLEKEKLFHAAVDVVADIVPGIGWIAFIGVGPGVRQIDFAGVGAHVGEGVEDVGEFVGGEVLGVVVAAINSLVSFNSQSVSHILSFRSLGEGLDEERVFGHFVFWLGGGETYPVNKIRYIPVPRCSSLTELGRSLRYHRRIRHPRYPQKQCRRRRQQLHDEEEVVAVQQVVEEVVVVLEKAEEQELKNSKEERSVMKSRR